MAMAINPMNVLNQRMLGLTNSVQELQRSVEQVRMRTGVDEDNYDGLKHVRPVVRDMIEEAVAAVRASFREELKKERHLLDVAMTYKCEHAITHMIRDKFDLLSKRCDILGEKISSLYDALPAGGCVTTTSSTPDASSTATMESLNKDLAALRERLEELAAKQATDSEECTNDVSEVRAVYGSMMELSAEVREAREESRRLLQLVASEEEKTKTQQTPATETPEPPNSSSDAPLAPIASNVAPQPDDVVDNDTIVETGAIDAAAAADVTTATNDDSVVGTSEEPPDSAEKKKSGRGRKTTNAKNKGGGAGKTRSHTLRL